MLEGNLNIQAYGQIYNSIRPKLEELFNVQRQIKIELTKYAGGKSLKGDEIVGWLGEIYGKLLLQGLLVDDANEHDFETQDGKRVSVKARKGRNLRSLDTSTIPKINGDKLPTHLMFVLLDDNYSLLKVWLFPWSYLIDNNRFKPKVVRNNERAYYIRVRKKLDDNFVIYNNLI